MGGKKKSKKSSTTNKNNVNNVKPEKKEKTSKKDAKVEEKSLLGTKRLAEDSFDDSFSSHNDSDSRKGPRKEQQTTITAYFGSKNDSRSSRTDTGTNRSRSRDSSSGSDFEQIPKKKADHRTPSRGRDSQIRNSSGGSQNEQTPKKSGSRSHSRKRNSKNRSRKNSSGDSQNEQTPTKPGSRSHSRKRHSKNRSRRNSSGDSQNEQTPKKSGSRSHSRKRHSKNRSRKNSSDDSQNEQTPKKSGSRSHSRKRHSKNRLRRDSSSGSQKEGTQKNEHERRSNSRGRDSAQFEQETLQITNDSRRDSSLTGLEKEEPYKYKHDQRNNSDGQDWQQYKQINRGRGRGSQKFKQDASSNWRNDNGRNSFGKPSNSNSGKGAQNEFGEIMQSFKSTRYPEFIRVKEKECDLFDMPDDYSLGHCVAEDMGMGAGIAVTFRNKFKGVGALLNQEQPTGGLAILEDKDRFIYYLVTKKRSQGKPTLSSLYASLKHLRNHIVLNNVTKLALPQIGCGLDRLNWDEVKYMLEFMFKQIEIEIVICIFRPNSDTPQVKNRSSKVVYEPNKLVRDIDQETIIIYFTDETGTITDEMKQLSEKFNFLLPFRNARKQLGTIITFTQNNYVLCGCVVKKKPEDSFNFEALDNCTLAIVRENRSKFKYYYLAFQAFASKQNEDITIKILNIVKHNILGMEIYVRYPPDLAHEIPSSQGYSNNSFHSDYRSDNNANSSFNRSAFNTSSTENSSKSYGIPSSGGLRAEATEFNPAAQQISNYDAWADKTVSTNTAAEVYQQPPLLSAGEPAENWDDELPVTAPQQLQGSRMVPDLSPTIYQDEYELFRHQEKIPTDNVQLMSDKVHSAPPGYLRIFFVTELIESIVLPSFKGFPIHGQVLQQNKKLGEIAFAKVKENYYFVIVKKSLGDELDEKRLFSALTNLRSLVLETNARNLAISNINFLGNFPAMVEFVFREHKGGAIVLYGQANNAPATPQSIKFSTRGLEMLRKKTIALYFAQDSGTFPSNLEAAEKKFKIKEKFNKEKKTVGVVIEHEEVDERLLFGCIVMKNNKIDFASVHNCVTFVKNQAKKVQKDWNFVGFLAHPNLEINNKIVAILQNEMSDFEITIHCAGELADAWVQK